MIERLACGPSRECEELGFKKSLEKIISVPNYYPYDVKEQDGPFRIRVRE